MKLEAYALAAAAVLHLAIPVAAKVAPEQDYSWVLRGIVEHPSEIALEPLPSPLLPAPAPTTREEEPRAVDQLPAPAPDIATLPRSTPATLPNSSPPPAAPLSVEGTPDQNPNPNPDRSGVLTAPGGDSEYDMPPGEPGYPGGSGFGVVPSGPGLWSLLPGDGRQHGPGAPTSVPRRGEVAPNVAGKVLDQRLADRDRELGMELPAAGRVQSIVEGAVRAVGDLPEQFVGQFSVALGPAGEFQGIQLLSYSGGSVGQWSAAVKIAKAQLAAQKLTMRSSFERGAIVTISVRAQVRDISGAESTFSNFDITSAAAGPVRVVSSSSVVHAIR